MTSFLASSGNGLNMTSYDKSKIDTSDVADVDNFDEVAEYGDFDDADVSRFELAWSVETIDEMISSIDLAKAWLIEQKNAGHVILAGVD